MRHLLFFLFFNLSYVLSFSQKYSNQFAYVRFECDACSYNHNPLAFSGGNILSATISETSIGKCLKLVSSNTIDTNVIPAYFDIYSTTLVASYDTCNSFRNLDAVVDCSNGGFVNFTSNLDKAGLRLWIASSSGAPAGGESTFQMDENDVNSSAIWDFIAYSSGVSGSINADYYSWNLKSKINMYGITLLKPNTEYYIYEINLGPYLAVKKAAYDCSIPNAVMDAALADKVNVYPNPSEGKLNVEPIYFNREYKVEIFSFSGVKVYEEYCTGNSIILTESYKSGLYFIKLTFDDRYMSQSFVVR